MYDGDINEIVIMLVASHNIAVKTDNVWVIASPVQYQSGVQGSACMRKDREGK